MLASKLADPTEELQGCHTHSYELSKTSCSDSCASGRGGEASWPKNMQAHRRNKLEHPTEEYTHLWQASLTSNMAILGRSERRRAACEHSCC